MLQGGTNDSFTFRDNGAAVGYAELVNQGTIKTSGPGDKVYIQTQGFTSNGLVVGSGVVDNPVNDGVIESTGLMQLQGSVTGTGTLDYALITPAADDVATLAAGGAKGHGFHPIDPLRGSIPLGTSPQTPFV